MITYLLAIIAILQVQDDIQHLRAAAARAGEGELDLQALDMAISRTERGINVCVRERETKNYAISTASQYSRL